MLKADGFDEAIIGTTMLWGKEGRVHGRALIEVLVYSCKKCVDICMERHGMEYEEAREYFEFSVTGEYMGEQTPVFVWTDTEDLDL